MPLAPSRARERRWVRDRLISALTDYALAQGITTLTGVARTSWLSQILAMGWRCDVLGDPVLVNGTMIGAFRIHVDEATLQCLANTGIYTAETIVAADDPQRRSPSSVAKNRTPFFPDPESIAGAAEGWTKHLLADGYRVIPDTAPTEWVDALNADLDEG